jgi:hypothetical protein
MAATNFESFSGHRLLDGIADFLLLLLLLLSQTSY